MAVSGAAAGCLGEGIAAAFDHRHDGDGTTSTALAIPGSTASTYLTHFFGSGLADDTYVVERFRAMVNGDIRRCPDETPTGKKVSRKAKHATATLKAVQTDMERPRFDAPRRARHRAHLVSRPQSRGVPDLRSHGGSQ